MFESKRVTTKIPSTASALLLIALMSAICASGQTLTTLYSFGAVSGDGIDPQAGVVFDQAGNLYGTASVGGISGANGIVYELSPPAQPGNPWTETIPTRFQGSPNGKVPECRLIVTSTGRLFGTTLQGGANNLGAAFEMLPPPAPGGRWKEQVIYSFGSSPTDGVNPNHGMLAGNRVVYGVTFSGGTSIRKRPGAGGALGPVPRDDAVQSPPVGGDVR